ncbi:hypothetical protein UY3_13515 [Chelonia mydas]|uniref:Uncharacterized protein n=1 Tax=Chelonia mydas TaxID=8469 RepID=M7BB66_CHEMY|nr:hypothetical protein UY3_13515 [Chelonia mydas]
MGKGGPTRGDRPRALLIPLISFIGLGLGSAALYLLRLALCSPDVRPMLIPSSMKATTFWKSASRNWRDVSAGAPGESPAPGLLHRPGPGESLAA